MSKGRPHAQRFIVTIILCREIFVLKFVQVTVICVENFGELKQIILLVKLTLKMEEYK